MLPSIGGRVQEVWTVRICRRNFMKTMTCTSNTYMRAKNFAIIILVIPFVTPIFHSRAVVSHISTPLIQGAGEPGEGSLAVPPKTKT